MMGFSSGRDRDIRPCEHYAGNVCSGFGGKTICHWCGWDLYMHDWDEEKLVEAFPEMPRMSTPCLNFHLAYRDHIVIGGGCWNFKADLDAPLIPEPIPPIPDNIILGEN